MAVTTLIKINNTELTKVKKYKVTRAKLWADAGRNMAGDMRATFIGIFPKISLEFVTLTAEEVADLIGVLDAPSFSVTWFDAYSSSTKTADYYAGDYEYSLYRADTESYEGFTVDLIPFKKLT